jgi:hypothetical protein
VTLNTEIDQGGGCWITERGGESVIEQSNPF